VALLFSLVVAGSFKEWLIEVVAFIVDSLSFMGTQMDFHITSEASSLDINLRTQQEDSCQDEIVRNSHWLT
jgi:hypothetical protein